MTRTTRSSARIGEVLAGRYRIVRKAGEGGVGEVFEAEHIYIHKRVAIKLLRSDLPSRAEAVQRLYREARATSSIGHPNIVKIEDFGTTGTGAAFLAMEWLEGDSLDARIAYGPPPLDTVPPLISAVCQGLEAAHQAGVVHRDLKPENIFLTQTPEGEVAKILDFGMAKYALVDAKLTRTGTFVGTPYYMAPEQATGGEVDARSDIYALGIMFYELATGSVPFESDSPLGVIHRHISDTPQPPRQRAPKRGISEALEHLILRCIAKDPDDRFPSAQALYTALASIMDGPAQTVELHALGPQSALPSHSMIESAIELALDAAPEQQPAANTKRQSERPRGDSLARAPTDLALFSLVADRASGPLGNNEPGQNIEAAIDQPHHPPPPQHDSEDTHPRGTRPVLNRPRRKRTMMAWLASAILFTVASVALVRSLRVEAVAADRDAPTVPAAEMKRPAAEPMTKPITDQKPPQAPQDDPQPQAEQKPKAPAAEDAAEEPDDALDIWRYQGMKGGAKFSVAVEPALVRAGDTMTMTMNLARGQMKADCWLMPSHWSRGDLKAQVSFTHFSPHRRTGKVRVPVSKNGELQLQSSFPKDGKYHVVVALSRRNKRLGDIKFDICVGADPRDADSETVCPGMNGGK